LTYVAAVLGANLRRHVFFNDLGADFGTLVGLGDVLVAPFRIEGYLSTFVLVVFTVIAVIFFFAEYINDSGYQPTHDAVRLTKRLNRLILVLATVLLPLSAGLVAIASGSSWAAQVQAGQRNLVSVTLVSPAESFPAPMAGEWVMIGTAGGYTLLLELCSSVPSAIPTSGIKEIKRLEPTEATCGTRVTRDSAAHLPHLTALHSLERPR
jgi:hypothetical protein